MRVAAAIALSDETRLQLEKLARGARRRFASCSAVGLFFWPGTSSEQADCRADGGCASDGGLVADRFLTLGVDGLCGTPADRADPSISTQTVTQVIEKTHRASLQRHALVAQHHGTVVGISESSVGASGAHTA